MVDSSAREPTSTFARLLAERNPAPGRRRHVYVPYDQLSDAIGPLAREAPEELCVILIESRAKAARRPYHKQKLALVLANQRHFALEQAARGVRVSYVSTDRPYADALLRVMERETGETPVRVMTPAERELREELRPLVESGRLEQLPHEGWLTTHEQFVGSRETPPWRMDAFYRRVRRDSGILMERGRPLGGKYSFDTENREPWKGDPPAARPPDFPVDPVKEEVGALVLSRFSDHPGRLDLASLPATAADARTAWSWALRECLPRFGPHEDAMSRRSTNLFHTRISALLNLHRLLPRDVVSDVARAELPLASKEGFIRQVLGWREFVRHVHAATDGFRHLPGTSTAAPQSGGGAAPSFLGADTPLPPAYWGSPSGLECLDHVVRSVWDEGYSHHITRLMILGNIATLLDVRPRELADWFWVAYTDAYDWVVEPNVLGMATFAVGDLMTTKPYVSGAAYVDRMSDYCGACAFDPRRDCPLTSLYWAFLERHGPALASNPRLKLPLASLARRSDARRGRDRTVFADVSRRLAAGLRLGPAAR